MAQYTSIVCDDGSKYCGECRDNVFHGLGVMVKPGSGMFEGMWHSGQQVSGTFTWNNGKQYMGEWKDMCRGGLGVETRSNGTRYFGEFTQNVMGPLGVISLPNQGLYLGTWKPNSNYPGGEKDGEGVEAYADGGYYRGQYKNGMRNGYGTRSSAGYEQQHLDTLRRGSGGPSMANIVIGRTMSKGNKDSINVISSLPKLSTLPIQAEAQNQVYEGEWVDDRRTGHGILKVKGLYTYYGEWHDNQRHGYGVLVKETPEGDSANQEDVRQEGLWKDGKLEVPVKHKMLRKNEQEIKVQNAHTRSIDAARIARQKAHVAEDRADAAAAKCQAAKGKAAKANEYADKAMLKSQEVVKRAEMIVNTAKEIKNRVELMTSAVNKDLAMLKPQAAGSAAVPPSFNYKQLSLDMMPAPVKEDLSGKRQNSTGAKGMDQKYSTLVRSAAVNADSN